ncbi:tRNA (adenosine(37)-N6)-threonylcarbamoyltransferase complex transferase subunit TsaD [Prosthecochloris vibrioformis]|uniref:tRNA N6-adenosine threonylcarbamoyltransferase n=1 Tax=Prosthecochloris vibrioformis TaxID=1098 RepID=A0A5C4S503_PROVB|nr:tRNA (adenosine(37)-N6)-threonylcarbamoyltransferase complex transferase subunit TsaD [Prosthecochloris vibrioformis]TNJ37761.1 tRNA (adenosine(37)-N6)-threonylcarbamoyltransferase complex transferase subunit TsaD [Prosthecochloris vibrioformis]
MNILGIETSCDETSAAVLQEGRIRSNVISSQLVHARFGGVVPELASREHERLIVMIVEEALQEANIQKNDLDIIAATAGPGLIGAVMVGLSFAQGLAYALQKPLVPVNHIEAHIFSAFIEDPEGTPPPQGPFISLTVSGGHTLLCLVRQDLSYTVLGRTIDDAAGEAFDKTGKMLGLDYPAGPHIDRLAATGNPAFHDFPRALTSHSKTSRSFKGNLDFSFSGLKTSVRNYLSNHSEEFIQEHLHDIAASIQEAIISVLVEKAVYAALRNNVASISIAGGVSANRGLRERMEAACRHYGIELHVPRTIYSTDNAAMIATMAQLRISRGVTELNNYDVAPFAAFRTQGTSR